MFKSISFGFQFYLAQYIARSNSFATSKFQVPLGMTERKKLYLYEMVKLRNEI